MNPGIADVHTNLGVALVWKKRPEDAIAQFRKAIEIDPGFVEAHRNLGDAYYYLQGKPGEAAAEWREVLRALPDDVPALTAIAWVLATWPAASIRNGAEAIKLAERAVQKSARRNPDALDALAAAYAEAARYAEAVDTIREALAAVKEAAQTVGLKSRLAVYEQRRPYRSRQN